MSAEPSKITRKEAVLLSRALVDQLVRRTPELGVEAIWALGTTMAPGYEAPPAWLGRVIRIMYTGKPDLEKKTVSPADFLGSVGAITGMAKMFGAAMANLPSVEAKLEERYPELAGYRESIAKALKPSLRKVGAAERKIDKVSLKPELQYAYIAGKKTGADLILAKDGSFRNDESIATDICFFLWLYWREIQLLDTISALLKFFQEMRQEDVTRKNLEKICRLVGLKLKGRGRPKNLQPRRRK